MKKYEKILFPVDLSESSPLIVPDVAMMADTFQAELHLLFVARNIEYFRGVHVPFALIQDFQKALLAGAAIEIEKFRDKYFAHARATIRPVVVSGDIARRVRKNRPYSNGHPWTERHGQDSLRFGGGTGEPQCAVSDSSDQPLQAGKTTSRRITIRIAMPGSVALWI
jgi:hypothetical protein